MNKYKDILVEITDKCLIGCQFCYQHFGMDGKDISLDDYMTILRFIKTQGIDVVSLTGGDVFMNPFLKEIVKRTEKEGLIVTLLANARSDPDKLIEWINSGRMLNLTFAGLDERDNQFFHKLISECKRIEKVHFIITYMNQSFEDMCSFIYLMNGVGLVPEINMAFLDKSTVIFQNSMANTIEKLIIMTMQGKIRITCEYVTAAIRDYVTGKTEFRCSLNKRLKIDINGNLFPCSFLYKEEHALQNIINGITYGKTLLCENIVEARRKNSPCNQCEKFDLCRGGCPIGYFYGDLFNAQHCFFYNVAYKTIEMLMK